MGETGLVKGVIDAGTAPAVVPSSVLGTQTPSNRITLVGVGGVGFKQMQDARADALLHGHYENGWTF